MSRAKPLLAPCHTSILRIGATFWFIAGAQRISDDDTWFPHTGGPFLTSFVPIPSFINFCYCHTSTLKYAPQLHILTSYCFFYAHHSAPYNNIGLPTSYESEVTLNVHLSTKACPFFLSHQSALCSNAGPINILGKSPFNLTGTLIMAECLPSLSPLSHILYWFYLSSPLKALNFVS